MHQLWYKYIIVATPPYEGLTYSGTHSLSLLLPVGEKVG
jgi:hypothetical protein